MRPRMDTTKVRPPYSLPEPNLSFREVEHLPLRLHQKIIVDDAGCWIWQGAKDQNGYGTVAILGSRKIMRAHRMTYELLIGAIPEGLEIDHLCRIPSCVNPIHLEPVTHKENLLRGVSFSGVNARKTHCSHGHEFNEANTRITPLGYRVCRACDRTRKK